MTVSLLYLTKKQKPRGLDPRQAFSLAAMPHATAPARQPLSPVRRQKTATPPRHPLDHASHPRPARRRRTQPPAQHSATLAEARGELVDALADAHVEHRGKREARDGVHEARAKAGIAGRVALLAKRV